MTTLQCPYHGPADLPHILAELRQHHRFRTGYLRAQTRLTLQAKAECRTFVDGDKEQGGRLFLAIQQTLAGKDQSPPVTRGEGVLSPKLFQAAVDYIEPFLDARATFKSKIANHTRAIESLAGVLPVASWAADVRGLGRLALGQIIAETGDLSGYAGPARVWKRMGLAVIDGQRQRRVTDPDLAVRMGYVAERRSLMFVAGDALIKLNQTGPYRTFYDQEKARQQTKTLDRDMTVKSKQNGTSRVLKAGTPVPLFLAHMRAHRHMTKRLLRDLWREWTGRREEYSLAAD